MIATPNTLVSILGGTVESDYGDVLDGNVPAAVHVPASIVEGRQVVATEGDQQARVIRYYMGRLPNGTPVTGANRLLDERTGDIYVVDNVTRPHNPTIAPDVRLDLRRVG